jgi:hypothetical protein
MRLAQLVFCLLLGVQTGFASDDLAKQSQNPVANMVSVPIENNVYTDVGPSKKNAIATNIKPVYPAQITTELNLINRFIGTDKLTYFYSESGNSERINLTNTAQSGF